MSAPKKIAIIVGSTRTPRVGLPISKLILKHLSSTLPASDAASNSTSPDPCPGIPSIHLELLDLMDHQLPYLSEPGIPMHIPSSSGYTQPATRAWSALISSFHAFVFVTPQYNWGIPGGLKNNIDHLYNEWKGKPAMVINYGGRGGGKAGEQLVTILTAMKVAVCKDEDRADLNLNAVEGGMNRAAWEGELDGRLEEAWEGSGALGKARRVFGEMVAKLEEVEDEEKK